MTVRLAYVVAVDERREVVAVGGNSAVGGGASGTGAMERGGSVVTLEGGGVIALFADSKFFGSTSRQQPLQSQPVTEWISSQLRHREINSHSGSRTWFIFSTFFVAKLVQCIACPPPPPPPRSFNHFSITHLSAHLLHNISIPVPS